ncbi:MAG: DUF4367 domain-containing protein [Firmicutes bacterium]|nr:DUF4367 domain-containing protein [Bacillota bacterium]
MPENVLPEEFFYDLAARASDRMMEELPSEEELSKRLSFSPGFEYRMERLLANPKPARAQQHRTLRVLAIAAIIAILLASALMSVSAVREAVFKFFTEIYEKYIVAWYEPEDSALTAPEIILELRAPTYIPPGYAFADSEENEFFHQISYLDTEGHLLLFEQTILDSIQYALDIEAENEQNLFGINGTQGMYRIKNEMLEMVWTDNEYAYKVLGYIDKDQGLLMAQSTK